MNDELEARLRRALRPQAPSAGFTERVMARIAPAQRLRLRRATRWGSAALVAAIVLGVGLHQHAVDARERAQGIEARRELLEALRLTDRKMELGLHALRHAATGKSTDD